MPFKMFISREKLRSLEKYRCQRCRSRKKAPLSGRSVECGPRTSVSLAGLACSFQIQFRGKCHNQSNAVCGALACKRQGLRLCVCAFQQAEEIAVGGKDERRILR